MVQDSTQKKRTAWIGLLGNADPMDLETAKKTLAGPEEITYVVKPETGMIMVQAKADGSNSRFNLGEVTVSRCVVEINKKYMGTAWIMGSDLRHAELAALFDGMLQDPATHDKLQNSLVKALKTKQTAKNQQLAQDASDTRVEFFTLKRGE
jgi:alpha-D-ribose 1-methylphosphonate 5-triphosphate synthase subunit PhnG